MSAATIAAIDPGGWKSGFACLDGDLLVHQTWNLGGSKTPWPERLIRFGELLDEVMEEYHPDVVVVEKIFTQWNNDKLVQRIVGVTMYHARQHGVHCKDILEVTPGSWKKAATGNGNASKPQYKKAIESLYGISCESEDEAAAVGMVIWGKDELRKGN